MSRDNRRTLKRIVRGEYGGRGHDPDELAIEHTNGPVSGVIPWLIAPNVDHVESVVDEADEDADPADSDLPLDCGASGRFTWRSSRGHRSAMIERTAERE